MNVMYSCSEELYENQNFPERELSALVASKVHSFTHICSHTCPHTHLASFPGSRSRKGEESLVTLGGVKLLTSGASSFM